MAASHVPGAVAVRLDNKYPFDWLQKFHLLNECSMGSGKAAIKEKEYHELKGIILQFLAEIGVPNANFRLEQFARMLETGASLRNKSNYEALLIAHEHEHRVMTGGFERLAASMSRAAGATVLLVSDAFNGFLSHDPDIASNREAYDSFLWAYLHGRIRDAIRSKLLGHEALMDRLDECINEIHASRVHADYEHIEMAVSMGMFGGKSALMRDFLSKLD